MLCELVSFSVLKNALSAVVLVLGHFFVIVRLTWIMCWFFCLRVVMCSLFGV